MSHAARTMVVLRRDPYGTVVDVPPIRMDQLAVAVPDGQVRWSALSWISPDGDTTGLTTVLWPAGRSRGFRPPPELITGDVIEFRRTTYVCERPELTIRWVGVVESITPNALALSGPYDHELRAAQIGVLLAEGQRLAHLRRLEHPGNQDGHGR